MKRSTFMKNNLLKFISTVLVLSICLTILPSFPALAQESFAQTTVSPDTLEIALQMLETPLLPEEDRPEAVESYLVEQKGHVIRLRELEEDLNTIVFQNRDGNKTMYYFEQPVKYVDKNGNIKDKKTTVTSVIDKAEYSADYGFVTSDNDIKTYFPKKLVGGKGILVEYQDAKIEVIPLSAEKNVLSSAQKKQYQVDSESRDSIEYNKAFGNNTLLKYTPTFGGFKEDIILSSYTGKNEFSFKIKTNGLKLVCEDGKYYLAYPATNEKLMQVGDIVVYDSSMVPNTTPSETVLNPVKPKPVDLTDEERNALYFPEGPLDPVYEHFYRSETVKENEEYILTIVVDEDYLTCEDTVYPVTVDPSLSLTASGFEDATIYTNYTSNQGASLNMFVGNYTERYGGTKGVARALVKFPGLFSNSTFASLSSNNIISVDFMLRDTMCEGDAVWIDCYRMNQSWSESTAVYSTALWNGYTGTHVDNAYIHYYGGTGSNGTGTGHWYHLDITAVVKEWMNGYYGGRNNHYGIMLKASDETQAAKTFGTSDNSSYPPKLIVDYDDGNYGSVAVTKVRFVQDEYVVPVGWSGRIAVTVEPVGASDEFLNWVLIDSAGISTINYTTGIFTALAEGTVTLAAGPLSGSTSGSGDVCTIRIVSEIIPEENKAIIIVPGVMGTELELDGAQGLFASGTSLWPPYENEEDVGIPTITKLMMLKYNNGESVYNIRVNNDDNYGAMDTYKTLYNHLSTEYGSEYDIVFFGYDWRQPNDISAIELKNKIDEYDNVILIAHSMGGIVASHALASEVVREKTEKLITLGTPFLGSLEMMPVMSYGELSAVDGAVQGLSPILSFIAKQIVIPTELQDLATTIPSLYELLPTKKYFSLDNRWYYSIDYTLTADEHFNTFEMTRIYLAVAIPNYDSALFDAATSKHDSLWNGNTHITSYVDTYYIAGEGFDTMQTYTFKHPRKTTSDIDGDSSNKYSTTSTTAGDETVLTYSASMNDLYPSKTFFTTASHTNLVSNCSVLTFIKNIIDGNSDIPDGIRAEPNTDI